MAGSNPTSPTIRIGVLHTVPALAGTFDTMIQEALPGSSQVHVVDASLLADARRIGVTREVTDRVGAHIRTLLDGGADAVLVTCSSIGEAVEAAAATAGVPVLRVDEPMARDAARIAADAGAAEGRAGRIAVLATLHATLGPTGRLIERAAAESGGAEVDSTVVAGAIEARESGDQTRHDELVRAAAADAAAAADVVVLAQASMAAALAGEELGVPVLTSPLGGVTALAESVRVAESAATDPTSTDPSTESPTETDPS